MSKLQRALKAREDATAIRLTYFYRPFQGWASNVWPYQALRGTLAPGYLLPPALQARCFTERNLSEE